MKKTMEYAVFEFNPKRELGDILGYLKSLDFTMPDLRDYTGDYPMSGSSIFDQHAIDRDDPKKGNWFGRIKYFIESGSILAIRDSRLERELDQYNPKSTK